MTEKGFEAARYLTKVEGKDYLEVKWRLLWLRTEHPEAVISTELVRHDGGMALFKARVSLQNGAEASGWGEAMTLVKFVVEHGLRYEKGS